MKDKLRAVNEATFADVKPAGEEGRALEWRRSLNVVSFLMVRPKIETIFTVNELDYFSSVAEGEEHGERRELAAAPARKLRISATEARTDNATRLFVTRHVDGEAPDVFALDRASSLEVALVDRPPDPSPPEPFKAGAFRGLAMLSSVGDSSPHGPLLEVSAPPDQVAAVACALQSGEADTIRLCVALQSFSYELDDALSEWDDPRDIFLHRNAHAALLSMQAIRQGHADEESEMEGEAAREAKGTSPATLAPSAPLADALSVALRSLRWPLWVIAAALVLGLLH